LENQEQKAKNEIERLKAEIGEVMRENVENVQDAELGKIAKILGGKRIPKGMSFSVQKTNYPYIRVADFENGSVNLDNLKYISEDIFNKIKNYTISKNDVYISIAGTTGLVGIIPEILDGKSLTENAAKIVFDENIILQRYLYQILTTATLQTQIKNNTKQMGVPKLALKRIETLKLPLPPLEIQQKIVSEIEKLETRISELESELRDIPSMKEELLKGYL